MLASMIDKRSNLFLRPLKDLERCIPLKTTKPNTTAKPTPMSSETRRSEPSTRIERRKIKHQNPHMMINGTALNRLRIYATIRLVFI